MRVTGEKGIGKTVKIFLQAFLYIGIVALVVLPFLLTKLGFNLIGCMAVCYPNGIVLLVITHRFIKLFDSLRLNNPFCKENVKLLKTTGLVSFYGAILWLADFLYYTFLVKEKDIVLCGAFLFLAILFFGVDVALYVLGELFREATEYKEENDLTI